jgi:hypothetical protein
MSKSFVVFDILNMLQFIVKLDLYIYKLIRIKKWDNKFYEPY